LRALHGSSPLRLDTQLSAEAQKWAECLAAKGTLEHSKCNGYGENLAFHGSSVPTEYTGAQAADQWYQEIQKHDFNRNCFQPNSDNFKDARSRLITSFFYLLTGHFSQLVWKETDRCGFGKASTPDGKRIYVVGRYQPPGNVEGEYKKNVLPLGSKVTTGESTIS
ncbi:Golgi-associated plant pathogenesis protein 1, partial [Fasciolopsis buskii]